MATDWATIRSYFTDIDIQHMKDESKNWPRTLDLSDCESTLFYAAQIYDQVKAGTMPIGEPRWSRERVDNFYDWWKNADPHCPS